MIFSPWIWKLGTTSKTVGVGCTVLLGGHVAVVQADSYSKINAVFDDKRQSYKVVIWYATLAFRRKVDKGYLSLSIKQKLRYQHPLNWLAWWGFDVYKELE